MTDTYLSIRDLAARTGVSERTIHRYKREIGCHRFKPRGKYLISLADFEAWMQRSRIEAGRDDDVRAVLTDLFRRTA